MIALRKNHEIPVILTALLGGPITSLCVSHLLFEFLDLAISGPQQSPKPVKRNGHVDKSCPKQHIEKSDQESGKDCEGLV
jgi:hypothetical protein